MYNVYWQDTDKIEFTIFDNLIEDEFKQMIHQIESLAAMYDKIDVLFDAVGVKTYDFKVIIDEFDFYKKYKDKLGKVALVSDAKFGDWMTNTLNKFVDTELKHFSNEDLTEARKWIFPSKLPA